ncbi:hypothetical protein BC830DRAFT_150978 [Chytriomyces sp. MP71]|nr:hypothetical protein BC830DRAFT_150978 [Chytriomyces sp. MP71]
MQQPFPNDVLLEVVTHNKVFKAKARDHSHRGHLIDKIMGYLKRSDAGAVPPFLIDGESCMGKTSVIGKALQKFVKLHTYKTWLKLQSNATKFSHDTIAPAVEYSDAFQSVENSDNVHIEPVIVARVCGLTPQSSNSRLLINSITRQILIAFGKPVDRDETLDVESYRLALSLARHDRPLFIVLAKADRLDQFNSVPLKLSWLLDLIPPHVKIIVSVQSNTSPTSVHEIISCRIRQMAPIVLYTNAAAEHRPPPSPGILASCAEDFFLNVGAIIAPIAKSTIKRMLALDNRKLRIDQEEALRGAFASVEVPDGNKYVPIRMLKEIYKISKNWKSSDQIGDVEFPISLQEALDLELDALELSHGYYFTMTFTCLLVFARDGLTIGELEDILSLDDYSLREALKVKSNGILIFSCFRS